MTVDIRDLFDGNTRLILLQVQDAQVALCSVEVQAAYGLAVVIVKKDAAIAFGVAHHHTLGLHKLGSDCLDDARDRCTRG